MQDCPWCFQNLVVPEVVQEVAREIHMAIRMNRLRLRRLNMGDRADLLEIMSDADTLRYLNWQTLNEEEIEKWLTRDAQARVIEPQVDLYFGAELLTSPKLIALVSFVYDGPKSREAGFDVIVNRGFRCQGYGTEAVRGTLAFAFAELNLRRVMAQCDSRNGPGLKMLQKAGLRREGEVIEAYRMKEEWVNTVWFALLSREYKNASNSK